MQTRRQLWIFSAIAVAVSTAAPAAAQVVIGGGSSNDGSVIVDQSVLERLGPRRTLPQLLTPGDPQPVAPKALEAPVRLKPPGSVKKAARPAPKPVKAPTAKPKPKPKPEAAPTPVAPADKAGQTSPQAPAGTAPARVPEPAPAPVKAAESAKPEPAEPAVPAAAEPPRAEPAPAALTAPQEPSPAGDTSIGKVEVETKPVGSALTAPLPARPPLEPTTVAAPPPPLPPPPVPADARGLVPPPVTAAPVAPTPAAMTTKPKAAVQERQGVLSVLFRSGEAELPAEARAPLERLAQRLEKEPQLYLQLQSYAEGDDTEVSKARRLSLSRALAVRSYLMNYGVRSTRIEVRALGHKVSNGPGDRVDLVIEKR